MPRPAIVGLAAARARLAALPPVHASRVAPVASRHFATSPLPPRHLHVHRCVHVRPPAAAPTAPAAPASGARGAHTAGRDAALLMQPSSHTRLVAAHAPVHTCMRTCCKWGASMASSSEHSVEHSLRFSTLAASSSEAMLEQRSYARAAKLCSLLAASSSEHSFERLSTSRCGGARDLGALSSSLSLSYT
jgi:hypothetical protein